MALPRFGLSLAITLALLLLLSASAPAQTNSNVSVSFDFRQGAQGWQAGFADYSTLTNLDSFDFRTEIRSLPPELNRAGTGFYIQGQNRSDDLFMFLKRKLGPTDGLVAGQKYQLYFTIVVASNAQSGCPGAGGSPGDSVGLKAGAAPIDPVPVLDANSTWRMNVNKGAPPGPGELVTTLVSTIANGLPCNLQSTPYVSLTRHHLHQRLVTANSAGELWLLLGTDSGFEGLTGLYYQSIDVLLVPMTQWPSAPIVLQQASSQDGVVIDSVTHIAAPFAIDNIHNFSSDQRTRLVLFVSQLGLAAGEGPSVVTVQAEDAQHRTFPLTVEFVAALATFNWLDQVVVRLPDELRNAGDIRITVTVHGTTSNAATVRMKQ